MSNSAIAQPQSITHEALTGGKPAARAIHVFKVPEKLAKATGIESIGVVEITAREHAMAMKRARDGGSNVSTATLAGFELALESVREVNGQPITTADGTADAFWNSTSQKIRELTVAAYGAVNSAEQEDAEAFLKSRGLKIV